MSKVIYEVTLSPDGKHSVSVKSDDPFSLKDALPLAKKIQEKLLEVNSSPTPKAQPVSQPQQSQQNETPICGVHSAPMVSMPSKTGSFWSCHKKNTDGSWCSYKPKPQGSNQDSARYLAI
jgi:hypothetical protein